MRNCPICDHNGKRVIMNDYCGTSMVNAEVKSMCLFECTRCGHRYLDGLHLSQAWFDDYYLHRYQTDDKPYSDARLNSLADCVKSYKPRVILDIGGMDGELQARFSAYDNCDVAGVGWKSKARYDAVILSHTLEHIYDVPAMFENIKSHLNPDGLLFVEVPIHMGYKEPKAYDYHWQHINKFRPNDLYDLFVRNGFEIPVWDRLPDYREYQCWRIVGQYAKSS